MIAYEKAKQKALENIPNADTCVEYNSVYIFYNSKARGDKQEDNEVVIRKDNGNIISYTEYIMTTNDKESDKKVRKI